MAINKKPLEDMLKGLALLQEEKEMWLDAGFYVPPPSLAALVPLTRYDGTNEDVNSKTARLLREATIERWERSKVEKVRVVEVDSHFDSMRERSQG